MAVDVKHPFQSTKADGADSSRVRASNWNAAHVWTGGVAGQSVIFDPNVTTGVSGSFLRRVLTVNTSAVGNVGGGTDDLMTYTLPAASLATNGQTIDVNAWGTTAANGNVKTVTFNFGATTLTLNTTATAPNGQNWALRVQIIRTGAGSQELTGVAMIGTVEVKVLNAQPAETLSSSLIIKCTGASGASTTNDVIQRGLIVEQLN